MRKRQHLPSYVSRNPAASAAQQSCRRSRSQGRLLLLLVLLLLPALLWANPPPNKSGPVPSDAYVYFMGSVAVSEDMDKQASEALMLVYLTECDRLHGRMSYFTSRGWFYSKEIPYVSYICWRPKGASV